MTHAPANSFQNFQPIMIRNTGLLQPFLGSQVQRVIRPGDRLGATYTTPVMTGEQGRDWLAWMMLGETQEVVADWVELGQPARGYGTPLVAGAGQLGTALNIDGLPANCRIEAGKAFSILSGGRRSLHMTRARVDANSSGQAQLVFWPPLRFAPADNAVVELAKPKLQGFIQPSESPWTPQLGERIGFQFTLLEAR